MREFFACVIFAGFFSAAYGYGEHIKTLEASFTQHTKSQDSVLVYSGKLYIKAPTKAKWVYEAPTKKELYVDGDKATIYEPFLDQASVDKTKIDFLEILRKAKKQHDDTYSTDFDGTRYVLTLANNLPSKLTFTDEFDNAVEITLHNVYINRTISDDVFVFVPPAGTDIIRQY